MALADKAEGNREIQNARTCLDSLSKLMGWDDGRKDEDQIGASYEELEEAMEYRKGKALDILDEFNRKNKHKMEPIPTFTL